MRKFIYVLSILMLGSVLVYQWFFHAISSQKKFLENVDFSDSKTLSVIQASGDEVISRKITETEVGKLEPDDIVFEKIGAFDGAYEFSNNQIRQTENTNIITIGNGEYVFWLNNLFKNHTILTSGIRVSPKTPGYFFIKQTPTGTRVYSYNAILTIELLTGSKTITTFELFPSLLFQYNPAYNSNLEKADILRVATIDSISYISNDDPSALSLIIGQDPNAQRISKLLTIAKKDASNSLKQYKSLLGELINNKPENLNGAEFIDQYPFLFLNDSKKDIYIKNRLVQELSKIVESNLANEKKVDLSGLSSISDELTNASENTKKEAGDTIKIYAELAFLNRSPQSFDDTNILKDSPFVEILWKISSIKPTNSTTLPLSQLFMMQHFQPELLFEKDAFENNLNNYLKAISGNLRSIRSEYSFFSFFLSQYLSSNDTLGQYTFSIGTHFITISSATLENIPATESLLRNNLLATTLYSYTRICNQIGSTIKRIFFTQAEKWLVLKDVYLDDGKIKQTILDFATFEEFTNNLKTDITKKKRLYPDPTTEWGRNIYLTTEEAVVSLSHFLEIFNDYPGYLEKLELDPLNQSATRLVDSSSIELSIETLSAYLSQFNGLDINSLLVSNDYKKDRFYQVSVSILGYKFTFKLDPNGNILSNVIVSDTNGKELKNMPVSIGLDEREKWLKDILVAESDPQKKRQADFKNFFEVNYLRSSDSPNTQIIDVADSGNEMTPQMKIFVQKNLLGDGDFRYVSDFITFPPKSIFASIKDGQYQVDLSNVPFNIRGKDDNYNAELSGYYVFAKHAFYKLSFTVRDGDYGYKFGWYGVDISPAFINVQDAKKLLEPLWYYAETLMTNYKQGAKKLKIDLNSRTVSIDSQSFPVIY